MRNFFKSIGNFLNKAEDYFDYRVRTGKYVGDIQILLKEYRELTMKTTKTLIEKSLHTKAYLIGSAFVKKHWQQMMTVAFLEYTASMVIDTAKMIIKYYAEIFIVFAITFPLAILLLNFFQTTTTLFFILFIPFLVINLYFISSLYLFIDHREKGEKISLWVAMLKIWKKVPTISHIFLFQISLFVLVSLSFFILALFFRYFFDAIAVPWSGSFIYWFVVIFIGILLLIGVLVWNVLLHQTFYIRLLDEKEVDDAFGLGTAFARAYTMPFFVYYVLLYLFFLTLLYWAGLYYLYLGITIVSFVFFYSSLFLGFLLRRKFYANTYQKHTGFKINIKQLFTVVIVFGMFNYALASTVIVRQFSSITGVIEAQRNSYFLSKELKRYTSPVYRFTIEYPQSWNIYEWRDSSVTFYNNYTGTLTGGIWLNIAVTPYDEKAFLRLYNARPGLVSLNNETKDVTTKVSNISMQGYRGVSYTVYYVKEPYPEYKTLYMLRKDNYIYEMTFTTIDKDVEGNNTDLFERIASSFRFIE